MGAPARRHPDHGHHRQYGGRPDASGRDRSGGRRSRSHHGQRGHGEKDWELTGRRPGAGAREPFFRRGTAFPPPTRTPVGSAHTAPTTTTAPRDAFHRAP